MPRTRGRPRKYSGPLQKGQTSIRGTKKKPKGGLNKTEKKQVDKKIKTAIKKEHVLKYMNVANVEGTEVYAPSVSTVTGTLKQVSGLCFSTTTNTNSADETLTFAGGNLVPMYMTRPFKKNNDDETLLPNALNGQYCLPKVARVNFSIERVPYDVPHDTNVDLPDDIARVLPVTMRILKVGFKTPTGSSITPNPNLDLFLDMHGNPTGINENNFTRLQARYAKVNDKKYTKLHDKIITLNQNNIFSANQAGATTGTNIITSKYGSSFYNFTMNFKLSQRKGGKLFYESPQQAGTGPNTFTSGGVRELLVILAWYDNAHGLVGTGEQLQAPNDEDLQIKYRPISAFVDAQ